MRRPRSWLARLASPAVAAMLLLAAPSAANAQAGDIVHEATIGELQDAMARGRVTSVSLVEAYLARIDAYDRRGPMLHSIIRLNPAARAEAAALDRERRAGRVRGPMHGIPIVVKDNFGTRDLPTSGGSIALAELQSL